MLHTFSFNVDGRSECDTTSVPISAPLSFRSGVIIGSEGASQRCACFLLIFFLGSSHLPAIFSQIGPFARVGDGGEHLSSTLMVHGLQLAGRPSL